MEHKLQDGTVLTLGITVYWVLLESRTLFYVTIDSDHIEDEESLDIHINGDEYGTPSFCSLENLQKYCKEHNIRCKELENKLSKQ